MSARTGSDVKSQEQAVRWMQSENLRGSSSFLKKDSTSYDTRRKNVHFQVLLQEKSEEFVLMDDWLCIDSSSSEDDEPSNQGEITLASEKGTTHTSVPYGGQVQTLPVLNFALNKTTDVEEENIVSEFNLCEKMRDPLSSCLHNEKLILMSPKNTSHLSTELKSSNCAPILSFKEAADNIPSVDVMRVTNKASTSSAASGKGRAESCLILDASEGLRGNSDNECISSDSDNECISSDEIEVVDVIESMPNSSLSCSNPNTHKVSGRETTFFEPYNVMSDVSGSFAPKNSSKTESFCILPRQTSLSNPTCVALPELKFDRSKVTSVHETPLRTECASIKKNSVGLELSDTSKTKISRAAVKAETLCNMVPNYGDHFENGDLIIISDDEDDIVTEPQNLEETSDSSFLCVKNLSVNASQLSRELPVSKLSNGDTEKILEHQAVLTHFRCIYDVTASKAKDIGSDVKKRDILSANADSQCLSGNKNATLEGDMPSKLSNFVEDQQPPILYEVSNHQPSNQNRLNRCQLLPMSHKYDHQQPFTLNKVDDPQQPKLLMFRDHQKPSAVDRHDNFQKLSSLYKVDDHQQLINLNKNDVNKQSSVVQGLGDHGQPSNINRVDDYQQHSNLLQQSPLSQLQCSSDAKRKMKASKFEEQTGSTKSAVHNAPGGNLPELSSLISEHQETQVEDPTAQKIAVRATKQQTSSLKNKVKQVPYGNYTIQNFGAESETREIQITRTKECLTSPMKLTQNQTPSGKLEIQRNSVLNMTEKHTPVLKQTALVKQTSSGNVLPPKVPETCSSLVKSSDNTSFTVPFRSTAAVEAVLNHSPVCETSDNCLPSVMAQRVKGKMGHCTRLSPDRSSITTTDKVSTTNKMLSNTAKNELSSKAKKNSVLPIHASATVIPLWMPANVRSPGNAQEHPSFSSPVEAQVHSSSLSPVSAQVHSSSLSLVKAQVHSSSAPVKAQVHSSSSLVKALVHLSPVKAQDHSSFSSLTATKVPVQIQSTSDLLKVIPTTKTRVQENLKTDGTDIWNIPKGDCKGRKVDFVNNDDGFSPLSSTREKTVNSAKCVILSSTGDRTNMNKNNISSQQQTMEMEPSELVTSKMMEATLESHLFKTKKKKRHKGTELNISSSLDPTPIKTKKNKRHKGTELNISSSLDPTPIKTKKKKRHKGTELTISSSLDTTPIKSKKKKRHKGTELNISSSLDPKPKIYQAAVVYENFHSCQGSRKGYLKTRECTPKFKETKITLESNVNGSIVPSPDSTTLISEQKRITEAARVISHNRTIDTHKHSENSFVIKGLETISKLSSLGPLDSAVEHLLVQSRRVVAEGKDPLELFLVMDNFMVLDLISQKVSSQIEGKLLAPDIIGSSKEALKMMDWLLEAASQLKSKEKFIGLDIDAIARATIDNNAHQIIAFIKKLLKYQGKEEAKVEDLHNIFMAVTSMHCKLTTEPDLAKSKIPDDSSLIKRWDY
ncbi:uncharacterized protein [Panulirus ornatus]|uniref:uncharacterized protein n=1 Tax=Panulirus ornatus TaxID=150431 RepID=UPI003A855259